MQTSGTQYKYGVWIIVGIHALCWLLYITYEVFFETVFRGAWNNSTNHIYFYLFNISLFYFHAHVVLPYGLRNRLQALWRLPLLVLAEILLFVALHILEGVMAGDINFVFDGFDELVFDVEGFEFFVVPLLPYLLYSTGYYFLRRYTRGQSRAKELERQHFEQLIANKELEANLLRMEQEYLRAQINPHLLYNTLSFVNYAAKHNPDDAERAILLLSDIMRYALDPTEDDSGLVWLHQEIQQTEKLIELNQLRFGGKLYIRLSITENVDQVRVVPLLLLTLVENIFKHGELRKAEAPASIRIALDEDKLSISTENTVRTSQQLEVSTKTGLRNLVERMELRYPLRHEFRYGTHGGLFKTDLVVRLQRDELSQGPEVLIALSR